MSKRIDAAKPVSLESQLLPTSSAPSQLPDHVRLLAEELVNIHGSIRVAVEASGMHLYLPCPQCLTEFGETEVYKKHLAFNVDKYFAGEQYSVLCMKCGFYCEGVSLSYYPPLSARGIEFKPEIVHGGVVRTDWLEKDALGVMIPRNPGLTIPIHMVPANHPARQYLASRNFDPVSLWNQFQCSWCETENPDLYYRKQPGGFRITSQGRLIFFALMRGSKVGWQARILEFDENDKRYFWHPYKREWVHVLDFNGQKWVPREGYEEWDPAKYWTAPGTRRSEILMGYDAAILWNLQQGNKTPGSRFCILSEGPLDGGRLRPPAMAVLGKSLTPNQAANIYNHFGRVITIRDNDKAGETMANSVSKQFAGQPVKFGFMTLPERWKDPGALDNDSAKIIVSQAKVMAYKL